MFIYQKAASMLQQCTNGKGLKDVLYKNNNKSVGKLSRLLYKAIERLDILEEIYEIHLSDFCNNKYLGIIMLSAFIDRGKIDGGGKVKKRIMDKKENILDMYAKLRKEDSNTIEEKQLPKYFILYGNNEMKKNIRKELQKIVCIEKDKDVKGLYKVQAENAKVVILSSFYQNGYIRILDKSSCLVINAGKIKKGNVIVDVCSSPGSKAIFSLLQLKKKGYMICVEKNRKRCFVLIKEILKNKELLGLYMNDSYNENERFVFNEDILKNMTEEKIYEHIDEKRKNDNKNVYYIKHKNNKLFIKIYNCDFFDLTTDDFPSNVSTVFLDPSCSSSGMPDFFFIQKMDKTFSHTKIHKTDKESTLKSLTTNDTGCHYSNISIAKLQNNDKESFDSVTAASEINKENKVYIVPDDLKEKVKILAGFQRKLLEHALNVITSANTFIYSTCSFFEEENEKVVDMVLKKNDDFYLEKAGTEKYLIKNKRYKFSSKCVRTYPEEHQCRGIFIAKIKKKKKII